MKGRIASFERSGIQREHFSFSFKCAILILYDAAGCSFFQEEQHVSVPAGRGGLFRRRADFGGITAEIQENSRIGLIGANGAGKSTLLNTICGIQEYETGEINRKSGLNIGYLKQNSGLSGENTIRDEMRLVFAPVLKAGEEMGRLHGEMAACPPGFGGISGTVGRIRPEPCLF